MEIKYKNKSRNGLKNSHSYVVLFSKPRGFYVYNAHIIYDITDNEEMDMIMNYASEISIKHNWDIDKLELEE